MSKKLVFEGSEPNIRGQLRSHLDLTRIDVWKSELIYALAEDTEYQHGTGCMCNESKCGDIHCPGEGNPNYTKIARELGISGSTVAYYLNDERRFENNEVALEKSKQYFKQNKEKIGEQKRVYNQTERGRVVQQRSGKKWRENNPGYMKNWHEQNMDYVSEKRRQYNEENMEILSEKRKQKREECKSVVRNQEVMRSLRRYRFCDRGFIAAGNMMSLSEQDATVIQKMHEYEVESFKQHERNRKKESRLKSYERCATGFKALGSMENMLKRISAEA